MFVSNNNRVFNKVDLLLYIVVYELFRYERLVTIIESNCNLSGKVENKTMRIFFYSFANDSLVVSVIQPSRFIR